MPNTNQNNIFQESKEYYSDRKNVRKKWINQYGCLTEDNDFYIHRKCITEMFNLVEVVADNKLDEFRSKATRNADETINGEINEVYEYNGKRIYFRPTRFFANKLFALKIIGYNIPADINHTIRQVRNDTTHGNETIVMEHIDLNYDFTKKIMLSFADCLIAFNMLDKADRIPSFDSLRIQEGSLLRNGEYKIGRFLGEGGSGRVYESSHKRLGNRLAIKELKPDKYSKELIQNESSILVKLKHSNIPQIYDVFSENGTYYIVMEYIDGITLDQYLDENCLSDREKNNLSLKLCDIMRYLHSLEKNIVYSDLKPQNILVNKDGEPFLIDFGVAKTETREKEKTYISAGYSAPEKYSCRDDKRADIYSFGMILKDIYNINDGNSGNEKIRKIIDKCTCYNPNDRYQSFEDIADKINDSISLDNETSVNQAYDKKEPIKKDIVKKSGKLKWIIPVAAAGAAVAVILGVTLNNTTAIRNSETSTVSSMSGNTELSNKIFEATNEFRNLFEKAFDYAKKDDKDGYLSLFKIDENEVDRNAVLDRLDVEYTRLRDHIKNDDADIRNYLYYFITDSAPFYAVGTIDTSVYDSEKPDLYSFNMYTPISETDGKWFFDYTLNAHNTIGQATKDKWATEILPFFEEDKLHTNRWFDIDDYSWMNGNTVIENLLTAKICYMLQDTDGSIIAGINIKNGKNEKQEIKSIRLFAEDKILGDMFNISSNGLIIDPHKSTTVNIHISPDHVSEKVKTQTWTEPELLVVDLQMTEG